MTDGGGGFAEWEKWIPPEGIRVHAGRKATPIGNDAIPPSVDIPDWLTPALCETLHSRDIPYALQEAVSKVYFPERSEDEPMWILDRFSFPQTEPLVIQRLVDSTLENTWPGWVNASGVFVNPMMGMSVALEMFHEALRILDTHRGGIHVRLRAALEFFAAIDKKELPGGEARTLFDHVGVPRSGLPPEEAPPNLLEQLSEMTEKQAHKRATKIREIVSYIEYRLKTG